MIFFNHHCIPPGLSFSSFHLSWKNKLSSEKGFLIFFSENFFELIFFFFLKIGHSGKCYLVKSFVFPLKILMEFFMLIVFFLTLKL